jgi:putative DNA primase/helicase
LEKIMNNQWHTPGELSGHSNLGNDEPDDTHETKDEDASSSNSTVVPISDDVHLKTPDHIQGTSDDALATLFADSSHKFLRYVGQWGRWNIWNGQRWEHDHLLVHYSEAREAVRRIAQDISTKLFKSGCEDIDPEMPPAARKEKRQDLRARSRRVIKPILSARTIHAVVSLSRADRRIASKVDKWDADPWLLNTPNGTVDLRTGRMKKHNPLDYITQITSTGPSNEVPRLWLAFLNKIMHDDSEMVRYLQKVFGYCLVGETKEHEMYFAYGTGANGKGVTLNTMRDILGDYGVEANIETFVITQSARHPTELAALRGRRLVTCGETDEGQRWAEARIKKLTGGDPIRAHFMRQDEFEFTPQFKLFLAGNHKPRLQNVDEAIERRFRLIPFTFTVPRAERDVDLHEKLKQEWPAILNWAIEGCLAWLSEGLNPPTSVSDATRSYLSQEDAITAWYTECCVPDTEAFTYIADLFKSWEGWARENGEPINTKRILTRHLEDREPVLKIRKGKREKGFGFHGIELNAPVGSDE